MTNPIKIIGKKLKFSKDTVKVLTSDQMTNIYGGALINTTVTPNLPGTFAGCDDLL
jgi:hypothetical protein